MFQRQSRNVVWVRPGREALKRVNNRPLSIAPEEAVTEEVARPAALNLQDALALHGLPSIPGLDPEAELRELLMAAAEIEHGLMAAYLYAAQSCTRPAMASTLRQISVEEMGHLVTVQNLVLAGGGAPYLGRYDHSSNVFDPFPFRLEPVSRATIAKYAACEMPDADDVDAEERDILPDILADAAASAGSLVPHRIGLLYMKIYWLLRPADEPLPDPAQELWPNYPVEEVAAMFPGRHVAAYPVVDTLHSQAKHDDWSAGDPAVIVQTVSVRADGMRAVTRISAQGEGFADETDAHFDRFVAVYRAAKQPGEIARPFATDPWYVGGGPPAEAAAEITSPVAIELARVGDYLYEILLTAITLTLHPASGYDGAKRQLVADFCIALMREVLRPFARALPLLPISDAPENKTRLSLCLTLPKGQEDPAAMHASLAERLAQVRQLARAVEEKTDLNAQLRSAAKNVRVFVETRGGDVAAP